MLKLYIARVSYGRTVTREILKFSDPGLAMHVHNMLKRHGFLVELVRDNELPSWEIAILEFQKIINDLNTKG